MNTQSIITHFNTAVEALPPRSSELRDLALAAVKASEALSALAQSVSEGGRAAEAEWTALENAAHDTRHAFLDFLLTEHGISTADAERIGGVL